MASDKLKGHAALWGANVIWGLNAPIAKSVLDNVSAFAMTSYRMVGACLLFWTASLFLPRERVGRRDLAMIFFASLFGIQLNQMLFLYGLSMTSPVDTSIIATVVPVLTMIFATLFLREPVTLLKVSGVALGAAGAVLLVFSGRGDDAGAASGVWGDVLCIASTVSYAIYLTAFRDTVVKYHPVTSMKWMFLFAAACSLCIYNRPLLSVDYAVLPADVYAGIAYVVIGSTFMSYLLVPIGQRYLRPTLVSMYNYLQPVVAVVCTVLAGMDTFSAADAVAALCIFTGVWLVTKSKSRAQLEAELRN